MTSPSTPEAALESLQATALTARCHNAFFRQKQLKTLHDTLRNNINEIQDAIKQNTYVSDEEATTEVAIVLDLVREHYGSIDATKELEAEYKITNGKNAGDRRIPWGVVYIEPQKSHTPFFSALSPLSAAIAAGACVALKLENNLRTLPSLLRKLLTEALESDTFAVISSDPSSESLSACLQVFQEKQISPPTYSQHVSPRAKVVAVVDRTADLASAAEQLVTARFAFGGTSPYAPDIVLVNEFVKKEFLEHVLKHSFRFLAGSSSVSNGSTSNGKERPSRISSTFNTLSESKSWKVNVITQGDNGAILDLTNLASLPSKAEQPVFCVSAITSLEHAISLVEDDLEPQESLLAGYHFGTPSTDKYLSQFVIANASFGNHIPFRLLLGPAAPLSQPFDVEKRYTMQQFTRASPAYITAPASQASMVKLLSGKDAGKAANELLHKATQEIKEKKRAESIAIGYFEQGILIGLGVYGIPLLTCIGATLFFGVRAGLRKMAFI